MRLTGFVAALSVLVLANACSKPEQPVAATASSHASALTPAPQTYQRMRFVSPVEQSRAGTQVALTKTAHVMHASPAVAHVAAAVAKPDPLAALESSRPTPMVTSSQAAAEPGIVVAMKPAPEPTGTPAPWTSEALIDRRPGAVVIRGGAVEPEKCDPLSDMRARRANAERGNTMRAPAVAGTVFSRGGRN